MTTTPSSIVRVQKLLHDGRPSYAWAGALRERTSDCLVIEARFTYGYRDLGYVVFENGDCFVEWYYFDRWYNVFQIWGADGRLKGWYCNVCSPVHEEDGVLTFRDFALDLFAYPDGRFLLLDEEEFAQIERELGETSEVRAARAGRDALLQLAAERALPSLAPRR